MNLCSTHVIGLIFVAESCLDVCVQPSSGALLSTVSSVLFTLSVVLRFQPIPIPIPPRTQNYEVVLLHHG